ncbi:MAG: phosphoglycerate kinase [Patescibacteria group bacterium]|jgi:3-phosphoglycerate kinase
MKIKTIKNIKNLRGKRVLVRCDFNVAIKDHKIIDDFKIIQTLPTIRYLTNKGAKVIIITHLGRPTTSNKPQATSNQKYTIKPIIIRLNKLLGKKVKYLENFLDDGAKDAVNDLKNGQILMLENIRFYQGEKKNDKKFGKELAGLADIYVNDALAVSHRAHASVSAIQNFLPSYSGLLLEKEILNLNKIIHPQKPLAVIMGGAKIETKVPVIKKLAKKASVIFIGGMISYDFLAALKLSTGKYKVNVKNKKLARKLLGKKIILPIDFVASSSKNGRGKIRVVAADEIPKNSWQLDIGPETIRFYSQHLKQAKTIIWNGPMGMFENDKFKNGTLSIARVVASVSQGRAFGIAGGGETVVALKKTKMLEHVDWVSTGGGAMLAYLAGEKMPGLTKLKVGK